MIYYFSATGNSKYVAGRIAEETGTKAVSALEAAKNGVPDNESDDGILGFVFPTYAWVIPTVFEDFLKGFEAQRGAGGRYVFVIATCGTTSGCSVSLVRRILKTHGISTDASFDIRMPDTWTPIFDLSDKKRNDERLKSADEEIAAVAARIKEREKGCFNRTKAPWQAAPVGRLIYAVMRRTGGFRLKENCTGCGRCASACPTGVLRMNSGHPSWTEKKCAMCLRCLHTCPVNAIKYGNRTEKHGQYVHPRAGKLD